MTDSIRDLSGRPQAIAAAMGIASPTSRDLHVARRILDSGEHADDAVAALLETFRAEDETAEAIRVDRIREARARTADQVRDFAVRRAEIDAPPPGIRIIHLRDELSRELVRLHIPVEFIAN